MARVATYVEFGCTGHRLVHVRAVADAFRNTSTDLLLSFWVPRCILSDDPSLAADLSGDKRFRLTLFEDVGISLPSYGSKTFEVVRHCIRRDEASVCFIAELDPCLTKIALTRPGSLKAQLVGTLFQPTLHYRAFPFHRGQDWPPSLKGWVFRYLLSLLMCHRRFVSEILVHDPLVPDYYSRVLRTNKFRYVPDYALRLDSSLLPKEHFGLPQNRIVFLLAGSITDRKGAREFLAGLRLAFAENVTFRQQNSFVIAGRVLESRDVIHDTVDEIRRIFPDAALFLFDRVLTDQELVSLLSLCNVVCIPYIYFSGMASMLAHAATYGHPVVGPKYGLLGELIRRYNLGVTCNPSDPVALKDALYQLPLKDPESRERQREALLSFGSGRSLHHLAEAFCDAIQRAAGE